MKRFLSRLADAPPWTAGTSTALRLEPAASLTRRHWLGWAGCAPVGLACEALGATAPPCAQALPAPTRRTEEADAIWCLFSDGVGTLRLDDDGHPRVERLTLPAPPVGPPAMAASGRVACVATEDGALWRLEQPGLRIAARTQGLGTVGPMALSADGKWLAVATQAPGALRLFDEQLMLQQRHAVASLDGRVTSRVESLAFLTSRRSFIVGLQTLPELWEVSTLEAAEPIHDGLVHDYRMGEAIAKQGFLGVRRSPLDGPRWVLPVPSRQPAVLTFARNSQAPAQVLNLDIRRAIQDLDWPAGITPTHTWADSRPERERLAVLSTPDHRLHVLSAPRWTRTTSQPLPAPAQSVHGHPAVAQLWVVSSPNPAPSSAQSSTDTPGTPQQLWRLEGKNLSIHGSTPLSELGLRNVLGLCFSADGRYAVLADGTGQLRVLESSTATPVHRSTLPGLTGMFQSPWSA